VKNFTFHRFVTSTEYPSRASSQRGRPRLRVAIAIAVFVAAIAGCTRPLPEEGSAPERVYVDRCGSCHRPYQPHSMTAAMWLAQVAAMREKIAAAGLPPLSPEQDREVLDYLQRNAGG
jgi:Dihaem cytochrome c